MIKKNNQSFSFAKGSQIIGAIYKAATLLYESFKNLIVSSIPPITLTKSKGVDLVDYKIYGDSKQSILPYEYQQVEYIEGTGAQYLVIDYIASGITSSKIKFQIVDTNKAAFLFGSRSGSSSSFYGLNWGGSIPYTYYNSYLTALLTGTQIDNQIHTIYKNKGTFYIDDTYITTQPDSDFTTPGNMNVFACNSNGTSGYLPSYARIFNLQFYDNDTLMVDLIPCYRKSDNEIGMYDLVSDTFYTNKGTGVFLKGSDAPTPEAPIEIQSVGDKTVNIFNPSNWEKEYVSSIGVTVQYLEDEDCFVLNGTASSTSRFAEGDINIPIVKGSIFSISAKYVSGSITKINSEDYAVAYFGANDVIDGRTNWRSTSLYNYDNKSENIVCNYDYITALWFYVSEGVTFDNYKVKIQLQEGTTATDYEPYGYKIPIKVSGKNHINIEHLGNINNWDTVPTYGSYEISLPNGNYIFNIETDLEEYNSNILFLSKNKSSSNNPIANIISGYGIIIDKRLEFTITNNEKIYLNWYCVNKNQSNLTKLINNVLINFIIEDGDTFTGYEPYVEPITTNIYLNEPLRKIGDYADYIDFKNQKVIRNIGIKEFNGTETIDIPGTSINGFTPFRFLEYRLTAKYPYLCNYLEYSPEYYHTSEKECLSIFPDTINGQMFFIISNDKIPLNDITSFKNWLAELYSKGTPLLVYYGWITPIEETIELPSIPTLKGTTILDSDVTIQPSNVEVEYMGKV